MQASSVQQGVKPTIAGAPPLKTALFPIPLSVAAAQPAPVLASAANPADSKKQKQGLQLPPQLTGIFSPMQLASATASGKDRAAKLAASFAASQAASTAAAAAAAAAAGTQVGSFRPAAANQQHAKGPQDPAAAAAAAAAAADSLIHQQALKAKQSVHSMQVSQGMTRQQGLQGNASTQQGGGAAQFESLHQSRMEALRLRNQARSHSSPHSPRPLSTASSAHSPSLLGMQPQPVPAPPESSAGQPGTSPLHGSAAGMQPDALPHAYDGAQAAERQQLARYNFSHVCIVHNA